MCMWKKEKININKRKIKKYRMIISTFASRNNKKKLTDWNKQNWNYQFKPKHS